MRKTGLFGSVLLIGILNESILASSQPTKVAGSSCQCKLEYNVISCQSNVITNFPADLINSCPEFIDKFDQVEGLNLGGQGITELKDKAFEHFPNLLSILMGYNSISYISPNAFEGPSKNKLTSIFLEGNNLVEVRDGLFDLPSLKDLNLSHNPVQNYTTRSWSLCHEVKYGVGKVTGVSVYQDFQVETSKNIGAAYCSNWNSDFHPNKLMDLCVDSGNTLDCSKNGNGFDVQGLACELTSAKKNYNKVKVNFPTDVSPLAVPQFGVGETAPFFTDFNKDTTGLNLNQRRKSLTFYGTKLDLVMLNDNTNSSVTEEVTIKADTVYLSQPITINFKLNIRARLVSLDHPLTMVLPADQFRDTSGKLTTRFEKVVSFKGNTQVRHRQFGLVDIVDLRNIKDEESTCQSLSYDASSRVTSENWFDDVLVNLIYVCAASVQPSFNDLSLDISGFNLDYYGIPDVVGERTFATAQKFHRVQKLGQAAATKSDVIHNVPEYDLKTITDLSGVMYQSLKDYNDAETSQENKIGETKAKIQQLQLQFDIIEQQQNMYFKDEQAILDAIFASTDNAWKWSFDHRNAIEKATDKAFAATGGLISDLQEQELKVMLDEAKQSVTHYQDTITKYKTQIERYQAKAKANYDNIHHLYDTFKEDTDKMHKAEDKFQHDLDHWKHEQEAKAAKGFFKCLVNFAVSVVTFNPATFIEGIIDVAKMAELLKEMADLLEQIDALLKMTMNFDFGNFDDFSIHPTTDYLDALKESSKLKEKTTTFDVMIRTAQNQIMAVEELTNHGVHPADFASSVENMADVGKELIGAMAEFADTLLDLSERQDDLILANKDLERAESQVTDIQKAIQNSDKSSKEFQDQLKKVQKEYQDEVERMRQQYSTMSAQIKAQFKKSITDRFNAYKATFATEKGNYLTALDGGVTTLQNKLYGLRMAGMTQRSMLSLLFLNFCDSLMYHAFEKCNQDEVPLLGDDMDTLLTKLNAIEWDSIVTRYLPGSPIPYENIEITIEDDPSVESWDTFHLPITSLLQSSNTTINLKSLIDPNTYNRQWRWRIEELDVYYLTDGGKVIPSQGSGFGQGISTEIHFPPVFTDLNQQGQDVTFLAQPFLCRSTYQTHDGGENVMTERCTIDEEFSFVNYKPSPNGAFKFHLLNGNDTLDHQLIKKMRLVMKGSWIPFVGDEDENDYYSS